MADIYEMGWKEFLPPFYRSWRQGQHLSLVGPTGQGKTTLALEILPRRKYTVVLGTKPKDPTLEKLKGQGYRKITQWKDRKLDNKILLWPPMLSEHSQANQRLEFSKALNEMYREGCWSIFIDEARYLCEELKMARIMKLIWTQGRSNDITLIAGCQRPAFVPTELYDQATHLFFWGDNDEVNLKRIGGIGWLNSKEIRQAVAELKLHQVLYVNSRNGSMVKTKVEL